jgi:hypothetical protein
METVYIYVPIMPDKLETLIEAAAEKAVMKAFRDRFDKQEEEAPQYISVKEAGAILNRSRPAVYSYVTRGILKGYKIKGVRGMSFIKSEVIGIREKVQFKYLQTPE